MTENENLDPTTVDPSNDGDQTGATSEVDTEATANAVNPEGEVAKAPEATTEDTSEDAIVEGTEGTEDVVKSEGEAADTATDATEEAAA